MKIRISLLTIFFWSVTLASEAEDADIDPPVVTTQQGKLQGLALQSRAGRKYYGFLGVSYGSSKIRFEPPEEADSWSGIKLATKGPPQCFQFCLVQQKLRGVEDCLFVNIYSPNLTGNLPVMVLFHGGGFQLGSANFQDAKYFMDEDVVLITTQFRVGALGFLNTFDDVVSGNMGLKDQSMALKWIQKNIHAFGGNPNLVTIFGFSAGGAAVHYHMLSPMSKNLFKSAISQSGVALNKWALQHKPKVLAHRLAELLECPRHTSKNMVDCFRNKKPEEIVTAQLKLSIFPEFDLISMLFSPSVEKGSRKDKFLEDTPYNLITANKIANKVPWIVGVTAEEGAFYTANILEDDSTLEKINTEWHKMAPNIFYYEDSSSPSKHNQISTKVYDFYFGKDKIGTENYLALGSVFGDRFFNAAISRAIRTHATKPADFPVYPYIFSYTGGESIVQGMLKAQKSYGVAHLDDLPFLFNKTFGTPEYDLDSEEGQFSAKLVKLFVSFARDGKPTSTWGSAKTWKPLELSEEDANKPIPWYVIDKDTRILSEDPFKSGMEFWENLPLKELHHSDKFDEKDEL